MAMTRTVARALASSACVLALTFSGCATNPVTGESELSFYSSAQELSMGDQMHPNVIYEYDGEYKDPELKRYLGTIVKRIHQVSHRPDEPVDFKVLNSSIFNAFAIPGHVYVTRGFLAKLRNEAEFAAVMGHELAHYTARHSVGQMTNQSIMGIGASLVGAFGGDMLGTVAGVGLNLASLRYGRSQEEQADRVGTYYLYRAGYEPTRALDMQKLLHSISGGGGQSSPLAEYMSTHPTEERRLARITEVIKEMGLDDRKYIQGDGTFADRWQRRLAGLQAAKPAFDRYDQAKKLASEGKAQQALGLVQEAIRMRPNEAPFHRLVGDIYNAANQPTEAKRAYQRSLAADPRYVFAHEGLGNLAVGQRDFQSAKKFFGNSVALMPGSLSGSYGLGVSLFHLNDHKSAAGYLTVVAKETSHPGALSYLGRSFEALGDRQNAAAAYRACVQAADEKWKGSPLVTHAASRLQSLGAQQ